jgi:gamma-glutamyltranspeptidase/glutathione hydrolase
MFSGKTAFFSSFISIGFGLLVSLTICGCDSLSVEKYFESGVIVTVSPIASEIGRRVFVDGGNAFDAAVAAGFALAVVYPQAGNIGGGGFAVFREAKGDTIRALDFREMAPSAATPTMFLDDSGRVISDLATLGARAVGVPGTVAGMWALWSDRGNLEWRDLVSIAARLADTGFIVDAQLAEDLAENRAELEQFPETAEIFFPEGRQLRAGDRLVQKDLAASLRLIADQGPDGFYRSELSELLDSTMRKYGGLLTRGDMENYQTVWRQPVHIRFDSLDIYSMPPPSSGGIAVGQILGILKPYDFDLFTPQSPEYIHLFAEAARLTFADRSVHLGDPDYYRMPDGLLDSAYLAERREKIKKHRASSSEEIHPGNPSAVESEQTTHFSVCDRQGNMVAVTTTINTTFGSKLVVGGAGFLLNNEMDDFAIKPGYPNTYGLTGSQANQVEPEKRMLSSMAPTVILVRGNPFLITGSPGGSKIITTVALSILNFSRFELSLEETVSQPRFHHQWLPDVLYLEQGGFDVSVKQTLIRYGYTIEERPPWGDLEMINIVPGGLMQGASDPRRGGAVAGY